MELISEPGSINTRTHFRFAICGYIYFGNSLPMLGFSAVQWSTGSEHVLKKMNTRIRGMRHVTAGVTMLIKIEYGSNR
jgi:hypothetical protein